jgi:hypothetical protein
LSGTEALLGKILCDDNKFVSRKQIRPVWYSTFPATLSRRVRWTSGKTSVVEEVTAMSSGSIKSENVRHARPPDWRSRQADDLVTGGRRIRRRDDFRVRLGELAGGVSPQPKVAEDPDTAGITAPVAGATLPTPDAAPAVPVNTDAN